MKAFFEPILFVSALLSLSIAALGGEAVYKSVDDSGHVTYSAEPPVDVAAESVPIFPAPSEEATKAALERARDVEQEADAHYDAMMDRRQREAKVRIKAQEEAQASE